MRAVIARVVLCADRVDLKILPRPCDACSRPTHTPGGTQRREVVVRTVPARLARCAGMTRLIVPGGSTGATPAHLNPALIKALVRAHAALEQLRAGSHEPVAHDLTRIMPLACLAPDITHAILAGTQPHNLTLEKLRQPLPLAWSKQRRALGLQPNGAPDDGPAATSPCP